MKMVMVVVVILAAFVAGRYGGLTKQTADKNQNLVVQCVWTSEGGPNGSSP